MSSQTQDTDECGFEGTQSNQPCENPATHDDSRCWLHTEGSEYREGSVMFRLRDGVHARLKAANTDDETLSDTVGRALDALGVEELIKPEGDLAEAEGVVRDSEGKLQIDFEVLSKSGVVEERPCGEYHPLPCGTDVACPETEADA